MYGVCSSCDSTLKEVGALCSLVVAEPATCLQQGALGGERCGIAAAFEFELCRQVRVRDRVRVMVSIGLVLP